MHPEITPVARVTRDEAQPPAPASFDCREAAESFVRKCMATGCKVIALDVGKSTERKAIDDLADELFRLATAFAARATVPADVRAEAMREFVEWCYGESVGQAVKNYETVGESRRARKKVILELTDKLRRMLAGGEGDDGEPVTEEWLLAEGWEPKEHRGDQDRWEKTVKVQRHDDSGGSTRHWITIHRSDDGLWWPIEFRQRFIADDGEKHKTDGVALLSWLDRMNRGHVRRLLAALGLPQRGM